MSYQVRIESYFEAAHNLRSYKGKPEPLHGHSWKVEVTVETDKLDLEGMAVDFVELKQALNRATQKLDYTYINEVVPFNDLAPSAENIAQWICQEIQPYAENVKSRVSEVRVWEGRNGAAAYLR